MGISKRNISKLITFVLLFIISFLLLSFLCSNNSPKYLDQLHDNVFQVSRMTKEQANPVWNPHEEHLYYYEEDGKIKSAHADSGALFTVTEGYNPRITRFGTNRVHG